MMSHGYTSYITETFQTFIPQDAAIFSGTLRENLDPFSQSHSTMLAAIELTLSY